LVDQGNLGATMDLTNSTPKPTLYKYYWDRLQIPSIIWNKKSIKSSISNNGELS